MIDRVTGWLAWAGLAVSVVAVVVSALAVYVGLRQAGSAKQQAGIAADTYALHQQRVRADNEPPLEVHVDDLAANRAMQTLPSALVLRNRGSRDLHDVTVEFSQLPHGIAGFSGSVGLVSRYELAALPALGSARIPLAMAGSGPAVIRTIVRVSAAADGDRWTVSVPCEWSQYRAVPQHGSGPETWSDRRRLVRRRRPVGRLVVVAVLAAVLVGFLVAKLLGWLF